MLISVAVTQRPRSGNYAVTEDLSAEIKAGLSRFLVPGCSFGSLNRPLGERGEHFDASKNRSVDVWRGAGPLSTGSNYAMLVLNAEGVEPGSIGEEGKESPEEKEILWASTNTHGSHHYPIPSSLSSSQSASFSACLFPPIYHRVRLLVLPPPSILPPSLLPLFLLPHFLPSVLSPTSHATDILPHPASFWTVSLLFFLPFNLLAPFLLSNEVCTLLSRLQRTIIYGNIRYEDSEKAL